jgi:hypothetical protein
VSGNYSYAAEKGGKLGELHAGGRIGLVKLRKDEWM